MQSRKYRNSHDSMRSSVGTANKYDAFLSYSQAADGKLAPAVQQGLQNLTRSWYRLRALRVFRDKTSLAANPALWPAIVSALSQSKYFLLMASPAAEQSKWVQQEVEWWLEHRPIDRMLFVFTEGELVWQAASGDFDWQLTNSLPRTLAARFPNEPLYTDLRWARTAEHLSLRNSRFREAILNLAAPIHGKDKDLLDGVDVRRFRAARRLAAIAVGVLISLTAVAVIFWRQAVVQRDQAIARQLAAEALVELKQKPQRALLLAAQAAEIARSVPQAWPAAEAALRVTLANAGGVPIGNRLSSVEAIAISPDGRWLAAAGGGDRPENDPSMMGHTVALWELRDISQPPRLLAGHEGPVTAIAFSPDSKRLASGSLDGTIRVWDLLKSGEPLILSGHQTWVLTIAFSPDGNWLASGSGNIYRVFTADGPHDFTVRLWDLRSKSHVKGLVLHEHTDDVTAVAFSPDGSQLASASRDGTVYVGNVSEMSQLHPSVVLGEANHVWVTALAFSSDGSFLATGHAGSVKLWEIIGGKVNPIPAELEFGFSGETALALAFGPRSNVLAAGGSDNNVAIWNLHHAQTLPKPLILRGHENSVSALAFNPSGDLLVTGSDDQTARVWNLREPDKEPVILRGHEGPITSAIFSPDGELVVTGSRDGSVRLWRFETNPTAEPTTIQGSPDRHVLHALCQDGPTLVTSAGNDITIWDLSRPDVERRQTFSWPASRLIQAVGIGGQGNHLAVLSGISNTTLDVSDLSDTFKPVWRVTTDFSLTSILMFGLADRFLILAPAFGSPPSYWDVTNLKALPQTLGAQPALDKVSMSKNRTKLIAVGPHDTAVVWDFRTADPRASATTLRGHNSLVIAVALSPDGRLAATGSRDGTARIWSLEKGRTIGIALGHHGPVSAVTFSEDGRLLATGGSMEDGNVRVWSVRDPRKPRYVLTKQAAGVNHLSFTPDSKRLASAGEDGSVYLWDLEAQDPTREPTVLFEGNALASGFNAKNDLAIGGNGRWLMATDVAHGTVRLWRLRREDLLDAACRTAGRTLSQAEREQFLGAPNSSCACESSHSY